MENQDIINLKIVRWPEGKIFGSQVLSTNNFGELYFTKANRIYFCEEDLANERTAIITSVFPSKHIFTKKSQPINRKGDSI